MLFINAKLVQIVATEMYRGISFNRLKCGLANNVLNRRVYITSKNSTGHRNELFQYSLYFSPTALNSDQYGWRICKELNRVNMLS